MVTLGAGLAPGTYVAGSVSLLVVLAVLGWGAWWLRRALLPEWSGPHARLAEAVIAVAVPVGVAQLLGSFGVFRRGPVFASCVAAGLAIGLVGRRAARGKVVVEASSAPEPRAPREEVVAAAAAAALVTAQWATHVAVTLGRGMTQPDTLWYHAPFAARFVQDGRLTRLSDTGLSDLATPLHTYLPLNGSLVHALAMLPFGHDVLSPLVNVGWFALAMLAAWCIGRRRGVGALCVLGTVVVLGLPALAGTQPGQAANDVATAALFLTAIALVFEGELEEAPTALAAVAAGLALGTKLSVAVPVAVLTVGVVVVALRARRPVAAALWCAALALSGGYWLVRNWVVAGNPLPWSEIGVGPFSFSPALESRPNLVGLLDEGSTWRQFIFPGFSEAYTRAWPVLAALALGGAALGVVRGRRPLEPFAGAAVLLAVLAHPFIPFSGDLGGGVFVFTLRYLTPVLMLGLALLAVHLAGAPTPWRRAACVAMLGLVAFDVTASHHERLEAWPAHQLPAGLLVGLGVVAGAALLAMPRSRRPTAGMALAGGVFATAVWGGGWLVQRHYLDHRYADAGLPLDTVNAVFRDVENDGVAVFGTEEVYPMFGLDLSNRVSKVEGPVRGSPVELCRGWRRVLASAGYSYIVMAHAPLTEVGPDEEWISSDPAATEVARDVGTPVGDTVVYRVDGTLDPDGCS